VNVGNSKNAFPFLVLLLFGVLSQMALSADVPAGKVVWWGKDDFWKHYYSDHTNGLIECGDEFVTNAVAIAGATWNGLVLRRDGTVLAVGHDTTGAMDIPPGLSNVVSVTAEAGCFWAIRGDGTVARWGGFGGPTPDVANVVSQLTNVVSIASGGIWGCLALRKDGTVLGFRLDNPQPWLPQVNVDGEILSNVVALASMGETPLVLKRDGTVYSLGYQTPGKPPVEPSYEAHSNVLYVTYGAESRYVPYQYTTADPVMVGGQVLSNVTAIASGGQHALALKKDGAVVAWGVNAEGAETVPSGLDQVIAIAATGHESLALKRDGTVIAWGADYSHQLSVPVGLSNVVAIASAGDFNLAITTGNIPTSVFIQPHGRLEEMEQKADLVFKGQVLSTAPITNEAFRISSMTVDATKFKVISTLKGGATKEVIFEHYSGWGKGGFGWSGPAPPATHKFEVGQSYLIFAARMDKPDNYYSPEAGATNLPGVFRQIADVPNGGSDGVMRTLDARPVAGYSVKEAHWFELNRLLNDTNPTNVLYAIDKLDGMSLKGEPYEEWRRSDDFKRGRVLDALLPLMQNKNEQVAIRAINCFEETSNASVVLKPYAIALIKVANKGQSPARRLTATSALSGTDDKAVSNSLAQLLKDSDENVRLGAIRLLPRFPSEFAEQALRDAADDKSANVRSVVADVIGGEKYERCLPVLVKLFQDPVGRDKLIPPTTMEYLQAGQRWSNIGDVHTAAGYALVKFTPAQVSDILKTNLNDPGFHISFVAKLAQGDAELWLPELVSILEARRADVDEIAKSPPLDPRRFSAPGVNGIVLTGTYTECWEDIRQYLLKKSPEELASGKFDRYLDVLDKTVGEPEDRWLYQLYRTKNLAKRAANLRQQYDKSDGWWFDDFNERGEAAQVGAISF
jgi:hypothetical protein